MSCNTDVGSTRVYTPEIIPGWDPGARSDYGVRYHGMGSVPSRRAVSPVMRVRAMSLEPDTLVSHTACDTPKKGLDIAAPELPTLSAEIFATSAVSETKMIQGAAVVPELVEGKLDNPVVERTIIVEGTERVNCHGVEADLSTSSERMLSLVDGKGKEPTPNTVEGAERPAYYTVEGYLISPLEVVPEIVKGMLETGKDVAPTPCGPAFDHHEEFELVVADGVVDERGKRLITTMGMKSSCHEWGLAFGLVFGWVSCIAAAAACAISATTTAVLLEINPSRNVWIAAAKGHRFPVTGIG